MRKNNKEIYFTKIDFNRFARSGVRRDRIVDEVSSALKFRLGLLNRFDSLLHDDGIFIVGVEIEEDISYFAAE